MSKFKFKANFAGYAALRKSAAVISECEKYANRVQQAAGEGFTVEERQYPRRAGAVVKPATEKDFYRNLNENILEKAWRSVRR